MASFNLTHCSRPRKVSVFANYKNSVVSSFKWDCEAFLVRFEKENTFKYANFANIWQLNNFTFIYADQNFVGPLKVLCEVCFLTVKKYIMFQESLYIKVGAFYLLYGLYYKQPIQGMVKIRVTLEEYRKIKVLMGEMSNKGQYDIVYIFAKMKSDNAFSYIAEAIPLSIELNRSVKILTPVDDTFKARGSESSINKFHAILEDETVQLLQQTCSEYDSLLEKFAEKHPSIVQFKSTIIHDLKQAHTKVFAQSSKESSTANMQSKDNTEIRNTREIIRQKAMMNKNAEYRGSKKVLTAIDLEDEDDEFEEYTPKSTRKIITLKDKKKRPRNRGSKKSEPLDFGSDDESD